ncbi:MAG: CehA/McbA family metallohydrolase, partial [Ginsengibacter sp.]
MKSLRFCFLSLLCIACICHPLFSQPTTRLHIKIFESDTKNITPAMVCITNVQTGKVHLPPDGRVAGEPTYPDIFFDGIKFSTDKNWNGPLRKMAGKGAVNGQRTYVYGMSPTLPYWHEPVMYQVSGDFSIDLSPGNWRVSIEHGNEYIPVTREITISGKQKVLHKNFVLKRWINMPQRGWYSGDVHAHHPLNEQLYRDYVMQVVEAEDLHLVNILNMGDRKGTYFTPQGFGKNFQICKEDICIVSGQEDPRSDYGHVIALNIDSLVRDTILYNYYDLIFSKVHRKPEALVGFAHFAYGGEGVKEGLALTAPSGMVNFVELLQNTKINTSDYYDYLNLGFKISAAAGSDFPWGSTIGDCRTYVYTGNPFSADKWFAGLKGGNTFVSNGPALFLTADGNIPGSELQVANNTNVTVKVKALSNSYIATIDRIELQGNDGLIYKVSNTKHLDSLLIKIPLTIKKSQWLTAAVYCTNGAVAHTSPIY